MLHNEELYEHNLWVRGARMEAMDMEMSQANTGEGAQEQGHREHEPHHHEGHEHHHHHDHEEPMTTEEAVRSLLVLGEVALGSEDYDSAVEAYASVLKLEENETAAYNLGSFYARGLGVKQNFMEAARLFHQAELMGNERAGKLCAKCMMDYLQDGYGRKTPIELYAAMAMFVLRVYPEADDQRAEVGRGLYAIGATYLNKDECGEAAKAFRAAAEFAHEGYAQYYLALLYNAGAGVPKNDLAALYWLDCAVDNGAAEVALAERDGLLDAFRQGLSASEFHDAMVTLATWCEEGTDDVPKSPLKAARWRLLA